jgi:hypothetical protein
MNVRSERELLLEVASAAEAQPNQNWKRLREALAAVDGSLSCSCWRCEGREDDGTLHAEIAETETDGQPTAHVIRAGGLDGVL